jgi:hypothetical protein
MNPNTITPTSPYAKAKAANSWKTCAAPGCSSLRVGLDARCEPHQTRWRRYGSATGAPIDPRRWTPYRAPVLQLFAANGDHPGLLQALRWLDDLTAQATASPSAYRGAEEFDRIARHGVSSLDVLVEVCAIWCHLAASPRACKTDHERDVAVSRAVFRLAPRARRFSRNHLTGHESSSAPKARRSALAYAGTHLRKSLSEFLVNVAEAVKVRPDAKAEALAAMRQAFVQPSTTFIKEAAEAA